MQSVVVLQSFGYSYSEADYVYALRSVDLMKGFEKLPRVIREKPANIGLEDYLLQQKICILTSPECWENLKTIVKFGKAMAQA